MEDQTIQKRQIAYRARIKDLLEGKYIRNEGWQPNYVITSNNLKISRTNIIGIVISVDEDPNYKSFIIDDSTGKISIRIFENTPTLEGIEIGDILLLIGKPRGYGSEIYIIPEIIKKLADQKWLQLRNIELKTQEKHIIKKQDITEEKYQEKTEKDSKDIAQNICAAIRQLDKGDGASFNDVLEIVDNKDTDKIIDSLIKQGEIFEVRAGKLMILEQSS